MQPSHQLHLWGQPAPFTPQVDFDGAELSGDDDSSSGDDDMSEDEAPAGLPLGGGQQQHQRPERVVDEDGFEMVQGRKGRGRR